LGLTAAIGIDPDQPKQGDQPDKQIIDDENI